MSGLPLKKMFVQHYAYCSVCCFHLCFPKDFLLTPNCAEQAAKPEKSSNTLQPPKSGGKNSDSESQYDTAEDDILDAVVRSATSAPTARQRERRKARNTDRKSCE